MILILLLIKTSSVLSAHPLSLYNQKVIIDSVVKSTYIKDCIILVSDFLDEASYLNLKQYYNKLYNLLYKIGAFQRMEVINKRVYLVKRKEKRQKKFEELFNKLSRQLKLLNFYECEDEIKEFIIQGKMGLPETDSYIEELLTKKEQEEKTLA